MLSPASAPIVRATAPVVAAHGVEITSVFYPSLFAAHPELLDVFNQGNQANGDQRRALAASVVTFAEHLLGERDEPFQPVLERIAHKHASLGVRPSHYTAVGRHLLGAVAEVLGDAVTPEVHAAWDEVYWLFATQLIAEEARLYQRSGADVEGQWRTWRVVERVEDGTDVVALRLAPADGGPVPEFVPGQYVSVAVDLPDGTRQPRQYTICGAADGRTLRIAVRRVRGGGGAPDGAVSGHLHAAARVGAELAVSHPFGDATLAPGEDPLVLISAGIGITPTVAMVEHVAATQPERPVVVVHADRSPAAHPLARAVRDAGARIASFSEVVWYEELAGATEAGVEVRHGLVDVDDLKLPDDPIVHLCGPIPFMRVVRSGLLRRGVAPERITYEVFGPDLWAGTPDA